MRIRSLLTLLLCSSALSLAAQAVEYSLVTTQTVSTVSGTAQIEYEWRLVPHGEESVELTAVSPKLLGSQTIPGYIIVDGRPLSISRIGNGVFANSPSLTAVTLSDSTQELGDYAFSNCTALASVTLNYGLRYIGKRPFVNTIISEIALPDTVLDMYGNVAAGALFSTKIDVSDSSHFVSTDDGCIYNKDKTRLYSCPGRASGSVTLPASLTEIMPDAFFGCFDLAYLNIPANVNTIGSKAFNVSGIWRDIPALESKPKLETVFYQGEKPIANAANDIYEGAPETLTSYAFYENWSGNEWKDRKLVVTKGSYSPIMRQAVNGIEWSFRIVDNSYAEIYNNGKAAIPVITVKDEITVPSSLFGYPVHRIGECAFAGCNVIGGIRLPSTVCEVGNYAFMDCSALKWVDESESFPENGKANLPEGIEVLGYHAFDGASKLQTLVIPATLTSIDGNPIAGCKHINTIEIAEANAYFSYGEGIFYNYEKTELIACLPTQKEITLLTSVTKIGDEAFYDNELLTSVTALCEVPDADDGVFDRTPASLIVKAEAETLTSWKPFVGSTWKNRKFVDLSDPDAKTTYVDSEGTVWRYTISDNSATITSVRKSDDSAILSLTLPASIGKYVVKHIGPAALANLTALTSIAIPSTYESIGDYAFSNCTSLASVTLNYGLRYIGNRPFVNSIVQEITLPDSLLNMYGNVAAGALFSTKINVSDSSHFVSTDDGCIYNKDKTRLYSCPGRASGSVTLPASLTEIMPDAFFGCFDLTYLNIPANVNTIGSKAFNVSGIWRDIPALESKPKLETVFYQGEKPIANAANDIYEGAPETLTSYAFTSSWTEGMWKDRKLMVTKGSYSPIMRLTVDGIEWSFRIVDNAYAEIYNNDTAAIPSATSKTSLDDSIEIPSSLFGYPVQRIGNYAFKACNVLRGIVIPSTVSEIGDHAFDGCSALKYIDTSWTAHNDGRANLPEGIEVLGYHAFDGASKLQKLVIPATLTSISNNPIAGCKFISEIEVAEANTRFAFATPLLFDAAKTHLIACLPTSTAVVVPESVKTLGIESFDGCELLESIAFPGNAPESAPADLFAGLSPKLTVYANASENESWSAALANEPWKSLVEAGRFVDTGAGAMTPTIEDENGNFWTFFITNDVAAIVSLKPATGSAILSVTLPDSVGKYVVKSIAPGALANLQGITSIAIPSTYESIGDYAFSNCTALASVAINSGVTSLGKAPFYGTKITTLSMPNSLTALDGNPLVGCPLVTSISADNTAFKAADGILYNAAQTTLLACLPNQTEITVPASVTVVADDAFAGCANLKTITFLGNAPAASDHVLDDAPNAVVKADAYLMTWPTTWGGRAVVNVGGLYNDGNAIWSYIVAGDIATITSVSSATESPLAGVTFPANIGRYTVKAIAASALANQISLTSIAIPSTYESIGDYAFSNCTALAEVSIASGVSSLGKAPFYGTKITSLDLPNTLTSIDGNPLVGCPMVTSITVDNTAFKAENGLLYDAKQFTLLACLPKQTDITVPTNVTAIADDAFSGCTLLETVTFEGDEPTACESVFASTPSYLVVMADAYANVWSDPEQSSWKQRTFINTGRKNPEGVQSYIDDNGTEWTYTVVNYGAVLGQGQAALSTQYSGTLKIPSSLDGWTVTTIGPDAFVNQSQISEIVIPTAVTQVSASAFRGCTGLQKFSVDAENGVFLTRYGILYADEGRTLVKVPAGIRFQTTIEETVTSSGEKYIEVLYGLNTSPAEMDIRRRSNGTIAPTSSVITYTFIPSVSSEMILNGVTSIEDYAFADCGQLPAGSTVSGTLKVTTASGTSSTTGSALMMPVGTDSTNSSSTVTTSTKVGLLQSKPATWKTDVTSSASYRHAVRVPDVGNITHGDKLWADSVWNQSADSPSPSADPVDPLHVIYDTELYVGVSTVLDLDLDSNEFKSVTAKGMPSGLKLVKTTDKTTKVSTWTIEGVPTKAKQGEITLTAVRKAGGKDTIPFAVTIHALPAWASGSFNGAVFADETTAYGLASATATAAGRITGKISIPSDDAKTGKSYSFTMKSFSSYDPDANCYSGVASIKFGKLAYDAVVTCQPDEQLGTGRLSVELGSYGEAELAQNIWSRKDLKAPSQLAGKTIVYDGITFKVAKTGKVTWSGNVTGDNGKLLRVSGSTMLFNDGQTLMLYIAPRTNLLGGLSEIIDLGDAL